ncbi:MAG: class I SAM-dependent methyltransferase [Magnetococcales bacterium]|nr:class I SAM-dependent methyltransferase [Magnetococcales bacterium]
MNTDQEIATTTGSLYASIWDQFNQSQWEKFSDDHFFNWSKLPVDNTFFADKVCLDAGSGSGRAVRSMLIHGAAKVCAIDMGSGCVRNTKERNSSFSDRLEVQLASVLDIPYPDNTFDIVHCDGVLHHTTDPKRGFRELVRVLKPGGSIILGLYGRGGLMNFAIYAARLFRHIIPQALTLALVKRVSSDPVFWYAVMDCMYVPIRENYYEADILQWLREASLVNIQRLDSNWGAYGMGRWMKGEGYIKFLAEKAR